MNYWPEWKYQHRQKHLCADKNIDMKYDNTEISDDHDMPGKVRHIRMKKAEKVAGHHCKVEINRIVADNQKRSVVKLYKIHIQQNEIKSCD